MPLDNLFLVSKVKVLNITNSPISIFKCLSVPTSPKRYAVTTQLCLFKDTLKSKNPLLCIMYTSLELNILIIKSKFKEKLQT